MVGHFIGLTRFIDVFQELKYHSNPRGSTLLPPCLTDVLFLEYCFSFTPVVTFKYVSNFCLRLSKDFQVFTIIKFNTGHYDLFGHQSFLHICPLESWTLILTETGDLCSALNFGVFLGPPEKLVCSFSRFERGGIWGQVKHSFVSSLFVGTWLAVVHLSPKAL